MKPPSLSGVLLIICLSLITVSPLDSPAQLENTEGLIITIQGTTLKASVPPYFIASFAVLGDLTSELEEYYLYDLLKPYDWDIDEAYQVLIYESGGNPKAVNWADKHRNCDGSFGLFQIACVHMENYGIKDYQELFEPEKNIGIAYDLWKKDGWGPWRNCWEDYLTN